MKRTTLFILLVVVLVMALTLSVSGVIAQEQGPQSPQSASGTTPILFNHWVYLPAVLR